MNNHQNIRHFLLIDDSESQIELELDASIYSLGRHSDSSIKLNSPAVSRHHATLIRRDLPNQEYGYILIDGDLDGNKSQNGILVNGKKTVRHLLEDGDLIILGTETIKAIYQVEQINNFSQNGLKKPNLNESVSDKKHTFSREALQNTLVLSEQNLKTNLKGQNIDRLASFPELSPYPIIEVDFEGTITYLNPAAKLSFENLVQKITLQHPLIQGLYCSIEPKNRQINIREIKIDNKFFQQYIHYLTKENVIRNYIFDITERKNSEEKFQYHALHDYLTGIPNREHFYQKLAKSIAEVEKQKQELAILFIDVDRFKNVNDTLSHTIGDKLLESISYRLASELHDNCFFSRWGGDEFTIIISPLEKPDQIQETIDAIMGIFEEPFIIDKHTIYSTCSLGVSTYPKDGENEEDLVKNADIALFRAKQMGKNNYQFYTMKLSSEQMLLFELEHSLHDAINNQELFLNFQPQLDLKTNTISGFEVLLRWKHSKLGLVSPAKFIPLAEETGLIIPIGEWILKEACRQSKLWQKQGFPPMITAVNVSVKQFQQEDFVTKVRQILTSTGFPAEYLELEITESILIQNVQRSEEIIAELSDLGVKFSLDDFGTGYSSLSYLKQFPFHTVKIDKCFIADATSNAQDQALISAIITLGKGYNMKVVAEGVETESQLKILKQYQCDLMQGRLLTMPICADDFTEFLSEFPLNYRYFV